MSVSAKVIERYISEGGDAAAIPGLALERGRRRVVDEHAALRHVADAVGADWVNEVSGEIAAAEYLARRGMTPEEFRQSVLAALDAGRPLRAWVMPDRRDGGVYPYQPHWTDTHEFLPLEIMRPLFKDGDVAWCEDEPRGWASLRRGPGPAPAPGM